MKLFPKEKVVGIFRGFSEGGMEFHADLVLPYRSEFQTSPMHGQFLIVQLESENEAVLGRITSISAQGRLVSTEGEDYGLRAVAEDRPIPEDLLDQYLKYRINIRVLGVIRILDGKVHFVASHRRLPHVGSKVAFLSDELLKEIAGHHIEGAELGYLAFGEFVYCGNARKANLEPGMIALSPEILPKFPVKNLVSRRSFVFARAGFGKSNLVKLLFSNLYKDGSPMVEKRGGKKVPVGTLIFDPDGEYFWPDDKNRPGLCDVPELEDKVVVFTKKEGPSPFYNSFVASDIKLDIRRLRPADVLSIALSPEKQDQQNVRKLKGLNDSDWQVLVDEIYRNRNAADGNLIKRLLNLEDSQDAEMMAARANMTTIVTMLHDPSSQMMDMLFAALKEGKICIVDVSQLRGTPALILSGLILQKIFDHNQEEFTKAEPSTIPVIAVIEEAQSVLGGSGKSGGEDTYIAWVKEGRKYDLGALLITQQPGSITHEILSQGDNWFIFHLLSSGDLQAVKRANAHFSDDILSSLLNEPIPGHGVFWSSAGGKSYPISVRVHSFESLYQARDPGYDQGPGNTFALKLKEIFIGNRQLRHQDQGALTLDEQRETSAEVDEPDEPIDFLEEYQIQAVQKFLEDHDLINRIKNSGWTWRGIMEGLKKHLPEHLIDREKIAYNLVRRAMNELFGPDNWDTERRPSKSGGPYTTWVVPKSTFQGE